MQRSNVEFPFSSVFATTWRLETNEMQRYIYSLEHGTMEYGTMGRTKETLSDSNVSFRNLLPVGSATVDSNPNG